MGTRWRRAERAERMVLAEEERVLAVAAGTSGGGIGGASVTNR